MYQENQMTVRDITTAIVQEIGKRDARIYELELISARDRTDAAALADALRCALADLEGLAEECELDDEHPARESIAEARALLARVDGDAA
jgi:hypothetical protein